MKLRDIYQPSEDDWMEMVLVVEALTTILPYCEKKILIGINYVLQLKDLPESGCIKL